MLLSATVLSLYLTIGYERSAQSWLFTYRSLPAFVLPLVLFPLIVWLRGNRSNGAPSPASGVRSVPGG
jgi:hypothetical protein